MDSRIGLDYIVENRDYISKLGTALDTNNEVVKKQVFELLSALCAYNADGYARAIETLEYYKNLKNERYRFKIVVNELEKNTKIEYQVALLAFINCVIISAATLQDRIRIRNEFIGLKVLPLLNNLRKVAQSVGDIIVQLDVFDEQRECDEAQSLQGPNGINLNSHLDVFYAILRQVADTPQEVPFLSILQHLLRIDPKEPVSDVIWDTTEKLVHRATLLENHEDSVRLLRTTTAQKFTCQNCRSDATSPTRKSNGPIAPPPPPPPAPAPPLSAANAGKGAPPPPPPPMKACNGPPAPPPIPGAPPAPPPGRKLLSVNNSMPARSLTPEPRVNDILLPQQDTPAPKAKMKTLNWGKIPPHKVLGKQNLWTIVANNHQDSSMDDLDWSEMEGLFCLQSTSAQGSPKLGRADSRNGNGYDTLDRKSKKESIEINLLDGKRSLNVNIFLKQFKGYNSNEDIVQLIQDGNHEIIGAEKLRGLLKILPEVDEIDMLKTFNGDRQRLGRAEKFLLLLMEVPNYKLRIESMLLKEEFAANITYLEPCINSMIEAGDDLINSKTLQEVLYIVVVAGNFLNSGGYAGNAAGVKLSSLTKLTDIRANKPGMNLIHFVSLQAEKRNPVLLNFTNELSNLEIASKTNIEQISIDIKNLDTQLQKIKKQIELPNTDENIKEQMMEFLQSAESEIAVLKSGMDAVESMRLKLSDFFCEDPATFRLEECFKIFQTFCDKFKQAVKENERRQQLEEQATLRQRQREEQLARKAKYASQNGTPVSDYENQYSLDSSFDPRASPALSRKRFGSFNNGSMEANNSFIRMETSNNNCDGMSPDITPNGSMRRRRSRVMAEEDDLMEFLRTSGHERNSRERKAAYGSLDRSWARRARSGSSSRKRPELLNIDFGVDRERAASPLPINVSEKSSPLSPSNGEIVPTAQDETKPRISREWRQKIETWLQSNENDEKQDEEYKRKRRLININRRSLENESESERKLDTLPEEKFVPTTPNPCTNKTNNANSDNNQAKDGYKRVYPDWKPSKTLDTDVVGTIQALADVNNVCRNSYKEREKASTIESDDVAATKSSTLVNNVAKSDEVVYRRQRSTENTSQLESIAEEDRRKSLIQQLGERDATDRLKIYIRSPSTLDKDQSTKKQRLTGVDAIQSPPSTYQLAAETASSTKVNAEDDIISPISKNRTPNSQTKFSFEEVQSKVNKLETSTSNTHNKSSHKPTTSSNRKEIDADNIETPPVSRRIISSPTTTLVTINRTDPTATSTNKCKVADESNNDLETAEIPGHFDRYSMARRTRRYKRPTDYSSGNEDLTSTKDSSEENSFSQLAKNIEIQKSQTKPENKSLASTALVDNIVREAKSKRTNISAKTITKLEKVGRHISSINQEDVQEALRNLKSPTDCPERLWSPPREIIPPRTTSCHNTTTAANGSTLIKISNLELNDEGFEETQSLVSDTPSHGKESTNSSCNEVIELPKQTQKNLSQKTTPIQKISSRLADRLQISKLRSSSSTSKSQPTSNAASPRRMVSSIDRSRMSRMPNGQLTQSPASSTAAAHMSHFTNNAIRRATSMRKTIANSEPSSSSSGSTKRDVERSSSRNSLRSSRSSINSGASTQTVKRMPVGNSCLNKSPLQTVSVDSSPSKRPLTTQNLRNNPSRLTGLSGVPASRSSSSGSSVGPNIVVVRRLNSSTPNSQQRHTSSSNLGGTSFKENQTNMGSSRTQPARSALMVKANLTNPQNTTRTVTARSSSSTRGVSSFMRPTTASSTKRNK